MKCWKFLEEEPPSLTMLRATALRFKALALTLLSPSDGINTKNAQTDFIPSCENLIGINQIEQQEFTQSTSI